MKHVKSILTVLSLLAAPAAFGYYGNGSNVDMYYGASRYNLNDWAPCNTCGTYNNNACDTCAPVVAPCSTCPAPVSTCCPAPVSTCCPAPVSTCCPAPVVAPCSTCNSCESNWQAADCCGMAGCSCGALRSEVRSEVRSRVKNAVRSNVRNRVMERRSQMNSSMNDSSMNSMNDSTDSDY